MSGIQNNASWQVERPGLSNLHVKISRVLLPGLIAVLFLACASQPEPVPEQVPQQEEVGYDFTAELMQAKSAARSSLLKDSLSYSSMGDLLYAAGWGSVALARHILERDGDVNVRDDKQRTPLFLAAGFNNAAMLTFLLSQGAELEARNFTGSRPIHMASGYNKDLAVLGTLVIAGSDVNEANSMGSTPLHWAAGAIAPSQSRYLLERGARLSARDKSGRTPLMVARESRAVVSEEQRVQEVRLLQNWRN